MPEKEKKDQEKPDQKEKSSDKVGSKSADIDLGKGKAEDKKKPTVRTKKKKIKKIVPKGQAYINSTYNNTLVTITDLHGNTLAWSSAGKMGFRGPKKATPYAAGIIVRDVAEKAKPFGVRDLEVFIKGIGSGRDAAIRALSANNFNISSIKDITPIPHNGCRRRKPRRV